MNLSPTVFDCHLALQGHVILDDLIARNFVLVEDWKRIAPATRTQILHTAERESVLVQLVEHGLLTDYQMARILAGSTFGLVLGNYRVLDRLGAGGMAIVFKAEHLEMRHIVAMKVLPMSWGQDQRLRTRFTAEMRMVAGLHHPNIMGALDAGHVIGEDPELPVLWYMAMEYVPGKDLEACVTQTGPMPVHRACNLVYQVACALAEIHKYRLVHRDVKPSNIMVTPEEQAKLLDFGLSRRLDGVESCATRPGTLLGTIDYMAPEQARDASTVDIRADIYSLGVTLFWCLTGRLPFPASDSALSALVRPRELPSLARYSPDTPAGLDEVLERMTAFDPADRYAEPREVLQALLPFLRHGTGGGSLLGFSPLPAPTPVEHDRTPRRTRSILVVDDEMMFRQYCQAVLQGDGLRCDAVGEGEVALQRLREESYDLVLLDVGLPDMTGPQLLQQLRADPPGPRLKIIMVSGAATSEEMACMMLAGADDFLAKPTCLSSLKARVTAALRLKEEQERADGLHHRLRSVNESLEQNLGAREEDVARSRKALVRALARLLELRDAQSGYRLQRLQRYCSALVREIARDPAYRDQIDDSFIEELDCCAPLYDVGKMVLPDHILLNPGRLTEHDRIVMQSHAPAGAQALEELARHHGDALSFLHMAVDIARHHHERWDGTGYPDGLVGEAIPLAARIVTLCDVYDALRSRRPHKPPLAHEAALVVMRELCAGQFDPGLLPVFLRCAAEFARIFQELPDRKG